MLAFVRQRCHRYTFEGVLGELLNNMRVALELNGFAG